MARRSRPSFQKRQKEMARQQKQKEKLAKRLGRKEQRQAAEAAGKDPDIAEIRPGPQPPLDPWPPSDKDGPADH